MYDLEMQEMAELEKETAEHAEMIDYSDLEDQDDESDVEEIGPDDCGDCGAYIGKCKTCGKSNFHSCSAGDTLDYCECPGGRSMKLYLHKLEDEY
jgi:hypothetical protein